MNSSVPALFQRKGTKSSLRKVEAEWTVKSTRHYIEINLSFDPSV
jgi:hypothetical protein